MTIRTHNLTTVRTSTSADKRLKPVRCTDNGNRWISATDCALELHVPVYKVYDACNKKTKACKGLHLRYEEDVEDVQADMSDSLAQKDAEIASLRAEIERLRNVERVRIENQDKIARLEKSIACHKRAYDSHMKAAGLAMKHLAARQKELDELLHKSEEE